MPDTTYQPKVYRPHGGDELVVASGGVITVEPGGQINLMAPSGNIYFVDSSVTASGVGTSWATAFATLAEAEAVAVAGDIIQVAPGHAETLTAPITVNVAGIKIIGLGVGDQRPAFTINGTVDGISLEAADIVVENLRFPTPSAIATAGVNMAAANCAVRGCGFIQGANSRDAITVTAAGEKPTIEGCDVIVTANGPDTFVEFEGVIDRPVIQHNVIVGSDGTNAYDTGVCDFNSQAITNPVVRGNVFLGGGAALTVIAGDGSLVGATIGPNTYGGSATSADNVSSQQEIIDRVGSPVNAGGTATLAALIGDMANDSLASRMADVGSDVNSVVTSDIQGKLGTDTEMADRSVYDLINGAGPAAAAVAAAPANDVSLYGAIRHIVETLIGTLVNAGGTATLGGILGDVANVTVASSLASILADTGTDGVVIGADAITEAKIANNALATEHFALSAGEKTTDGVIVTRATAALPQTTAVALFTVTGHVLMKRILGVVTVEIGAVANVAHLRVNSTGAGATTDICLAAGGLNLTGDVVDTMYQIDGTFGNAMIATTNLPIAKQQAVDIVIPPGSIELACAGSDGGGGRVRWSVTYVPLEAGAQVVAA